MAVWLRSPALPAGWGPSSRSGSPRPGRRSPGPMSPRSTIDEVGAGLGLPAERWDGRAVDLLDEEATRAWCAALLERFGRVDALLHLVGGWRGGQPLHEEPLEDWALLHDLLIRTVQHTTRAFHDALLASEARPLRPRLRQAGAGARPTPTPPTPPPRPPPRPGPSPSPTASKAAARPPTSSSSTRSSRRACARRARARIPHLHPRRGTSPRRSHSSARTRPKR